MTTTYELKINCGGLIQPVAVGMQARQVRCGKTLPFLTTLCDCGQNTRLGHNFCRVKDHRAHVFILHRLVAQMDQPFGRRERTPLWRNNFKYVCHFLAPILEVLSDAFCSLQGYT